jgi:GntR family transcriptional regulator
MPTRPVRPLSPYRAIAAQWRTAILDGTLPAGATLPTVKELAARHHVAASTINRATALLAAEHLIRRQSRPSRHQHPTADTGERRRPAARPRSTRPQQAARTAASASGRRVSAARVAWFARW